MENFENLNKVPALDQEKNYKNKKKLLVVFFVLALLALSGAAAFSYWYWFNPGAKNKSAAMQEKNYIELDKTLVDFQNFKSSFSFPKYEYQKSSFTPAIPAYQLSVTDLTNLPNFEKNMNSKFSAPQQEALNSNNFFVALNIDKFYGENPTDSSSRVDDWTDLYDRIGGLADPQYRKPENSVFITSDFLLHVYHRLLEKEFEYIEQREFYPRIKNISQEMLRLSVSQYNGADSAEKKDSFKRLSAYFAVPAAILDSASGYYDQEITIDDPSIDSKEAVMASLDKMKSEMPADSYNLAKQEINLIMDSNLSASSPIFGDLQKEQDLVFPEDYTQYGPRSHYGKNPLLRTYFRSMMWYGRQIFMAKSPKLTSDAINITLLMQTKPDLWKKWEDIYIPTTFFVGESDDLGMTDYGKIIESKKNLPVGNKLTAAVQEDLKNYKNPQIMSSLAVGDAVTNTSKEELQAKTKGFRFMGQRFTPDAFIFSTLTQGDELPDPVIKESLPSMPTALMVMSIMGSKKADSYLEGWIDKNASGSKNIIAKRKSELKDYFSKYNENDWTKNIYWSWLYAIRSLFQEDMDKTGYPNFMKNESWNDKNLSCAMGSWTELKHDTLLYAKQSYAERGGGGDEEKIPPVPKGYVEPNVEFFDRLIPLVKLTQNGLEGRNLLPEIFSGRTDRLVDSLEFFRKIAVAEVNNQKISDEDFERLRLEGGFLSSPISPLPNEQGTEDNARSALIADVHTDGARGNILYEATGVPNYIFTAVKDVNGTRLTKGLAYSHYEFAGELGKRLTDTDWKEWVYGEKDKLPALSDWSKTLVK
jgi:hypothetical protein